MLAGSSPNTFLSMAVTGFARSCANRDGETNRESQIQEIRVLQNKLAQSDNGHHCFSDNPAGKLMTPGEHLQEKTAPEGSSLHYSLMSLPLPLRRAVIAVYAFRKQIVQIVDECPELSVAKAKLDWWREEMQYYGVNPTDLIKSHTSEPLRQLFRFQAERARAYHRRALQQLPEQDRYSQRSQIILAELAMRLLEEIETDGYRLLEHRISLTPLRKFRIAWWAVRREHYRYHFK